MTDKVSFSLPCLEALVAAENSCVYCKKSCKRSLILSPIHLSNIKLSIKEMLKSAVTTYDLELDGIILSHKNVKLISGVHFNDEGKFKIDYLADIYIFKPSVGSVLTGQVNKRSKDIIGCLVHSVFNVAIPRKSKKQWLGQNVQVGQTVTFNVVKLDFTSSLPYIMGELISVESAERDEGMDSGVQEIDDEVCLNNKKVKQGGTSKKENLLARHSQKHKLSDSEEDVFINKKIKKVRLMEDSSQNVADQDVNVTKRRKKHLKKSSMENEQSFHLSPTVETNFNEENLDSSTPHPKKKKKKQRQEDTSVTESKSLDESMIVQNTNKKKKKRSRAQIADTNVDNTNTSEIEGSFLIENIEENKFDVHNELSTVDLGENPKKKHKKDLQTSFVDIKKKKKKKKKSIGENEMLSGTASEPTMQTGEIGDLLDAVNSVKDAKEEKKKKKHKKASVDLSNIETATSIEEVKNQLLEEVTATVIEQENSAGVEKKKKKKKKVEQINVSVGTVESGVIDEGKVHGHANSSGKRKKKARITESSLSVEEVKKKLLWEAKATVSETENSAGEKKKKKKKQDEIKMDVSVDVKNLFTEETHKQEIVGEKKKKKKKSLEAKMNISLEEVKNKLLGEAEATVKGNSGLTELQKPVVQTEIDVDLEKVKNKLLAEAKASVSEQETDVEKTKKRKKRRSSKLDMTDSEIKDELLAKAEASVNEQVMNKTSKKKKKRSEKTEPEPGKEFSVDSIVSAVQQKEKHKKQKLLTDKGQNRLDDIRTQLLANAEALVQEQLSDKNKQEIQVNEDGENIKSLKKKHTKKRKKDKSNDKQLEPLKM